MFATDPARAAREIRRVLRPGGRVALAVWGPRERNPWLGVVFDAVSAQTRRAGAAAGRARARSRSATPSALAALLAGAGLTRRGGQRAAGAAARRLLRRVVGTHVRARRSAREDAGSAARGGQGGAPRAPAGGGAPYETPSGVEIPGVTLIASARR